MQYAALCYAVGTAAGVMPYIGPCYLFIHSFTHCVTAEKAGLPNTADQLKINGSQVGSVLGQGVGAEEG